MPDHTITMTRLLLLCFFLVCLSDSRAQAPASQLYVFDIRVEDTLVSLSQPRYLSAFNPTGYNDHPHWANANVLYASVKMPGMSQPDVYAFDLRLRSKTRMTATESGEYSPKKVMGSDRFSAVRQQFRERDTLLRIWEFPTDLSDNGKPVFSNTAGIGYYEWLNSNQLALFLVGQPNRLVLASTTGQPVRTLATNTGRTFTRLRNGNLVYVDKQATPFQLVEQNLYRLEDAAKPVAPMLGGSEDFVVLPDGGYLAGRDDKLYRLRVGQTTWVEVVDLSAYGISGISRLSINGLGQLALVAL